MGQFNIDKYFRSRIKNHADEMDTDALWAALDLEKKEKKRGLIFWLKGLTAILFLAGIVFFYASYHSKQQPLANHSTQKEASKEHINTKEFNLKTSPSEIVTNSQKTTINTKNSTSTKLENSPTINRRKSNLDNTQSILNSNDKSTPKIDKTKETKRYEIAKMSPNLRNKNFEKLIATSSAHSFNAATPLVAIPSLDMSTVSSNKKDMPYFIPNCNFISPIKTNKLRTAINFYGGYSFINRNLHAISSTDNDPFLTARNNSETMLETATLGAEIQHRFRSRFYAKVGIQYQSINEQFQWRSLKMDTVQINNAVLSRYVSAQNDTTEIIGQGLGTVDSEKNWLSYNSHRFINIPVSLGYEINTGPWSFFAEGSFHFNITKKFKGNQLDLDTSVSANPNYLTTTPIHSFSFSAGIGYQFTKRLSLYAQPHYQNFLGSFTTKASNLTQKYQLYGIRIGASYIFD